MRHRLIGASLLTAAILLLPMSLNAQTKKKEKDPGPPIDSAKLLSGKFFGTLKDVPGSDRVFVVTIEEAILVPSPRNNTATNQAIAKLQPKITQATNQYNRARKAGPKANALAKLQNLQNQLAVLQAVLTAPGPDGAPAGYKYAKTKRNVEFQHTEAVKVRTMVLPEQFDDKGNIKKYTAAEKLKLKGKDKHLIGYESELEKLVAGQKVRVTLVKRPKPPVDKEKEAEEAKLTAEEKKALAKDKEEIPDGEKKRQVKLIVIVEEAPAEPESPGGKSRMPAVNGVGEPCAGEPHARFEAAGTGNGATWPWSQQ